jgi:hypothetical protein
MGRLTVRIARGLAVAIGLAWPHVLEAQQFSRGLEVRPIHLGTRCANHAPVGGAWQAVYAALAAPGDPVMDPALEVLQDSLTTILGSDPNALDTRFLLASVMGARSEVNTGRAKLEWAGAMEVEARHILERDPGHPGAHHLTGRLHAAVRRMSGFKRFLARTLFGGDVLEGGSWETARTHLEVAESADPCVPDHHYELARLYQDLDMWAEVEREVRHTLELTGTHEAYAHVRRKALSLLTDGPFPDEPDGGG